MEKNLEILKDRLRIKVIFIRVFVNNNLPSQKERRKKRKKEIYKREIQYIH